MATPVAVPLSVSEMGMSEVERAQALARRYHADFVDLKRLLREISEPLDHVFLNDMEPFTTLNPSAENIAWYICDKLQKGMHQKNEVEVAEVKVWETDVQSASYKPNGKLQ